MEECQLIDFDEGKKMLSTHHHLYLRRFYEEDLDNIKKTLNSTFTKRNWSQFKRAIHGLKGKSVFLGATKCREYSEALLKSLSEPNFTVQKISFSYTELQLHLQKLSKYLKDYFEISKLRHTDQANLDEKIGQKRILHRIVIKAVPSVWRINVEENLSEFHLNDDEENRKYDEVFNEWKCRIC